MSEDILLRIIAQDQYSAEMKEAKASIDKMTDAEKKSTEAAKLHADQMQKLGNIAKGAAVAGIAALGAAIGDSVKEAMDYNKAMRDLSQNIGMTIEETSRLIQTADDFTVSQEAVTNAMQMMVKRGMAPSISGLADIADKYVAIKSPVEQAALMTELLGRNWTALTPMLKEGGQAIRDAAASQSDSLIVTEEAAKKTRDFEKTIDSLNDKILGLKLTVGNKLIPVLNNLATDLDFSTKVWNFNATELDRNQAMYDGMVAKFGENFEGAEKLRGKIKELTEAQMSLVDVVYGKSLGAFSAQMKALQDQSTTTGTWKDVLQSAGGLMAVWSDGQKKYTEESAAFVTQVAANQAAVDALRSAANETVISIDSMAQSLVGATKTQATTALAQNALATIQEAGATGRLSPDQAIEATNAVMLQYKLATPASLAMAAAQEAVNKSFLDANMSAPAYIDAIGKIPGIAADGKVTWDDLNNLGLKPVNTSIQELTEYSRTLKETGITPLTGEIKTLVTDGLTKAAELGTGWKNTMMVMKSESFSFTDAMIQKFKEIPSTIPVNVAITVTGDQAMQDAVARARAKGLLP